jgi:hypothetical protein
VHEIVLEPSLIYVCSRPSIQYSSHGAVQSSVPVTIPHPRIHSRSAVPRLTTATRFELPWGRRVGPSCGERHSTVHPRSDLQLLTLHCAVDKEMSSHLLCCPVMRIRLNCAARYCVELLCASTVIHRCSLVLPTVLPWHT